ncbi:MAG: mechanosensitive ion channel, partial [bacterium]|nr:mechanosensitive ion channel [bacterium]
GDFIVVGDKMGTVTRIGLKTTRMISMAGEELIIPNNVLTGREIQNFGRVKRRRGVITVAVTYDTSVSKMEKIPQLIKDVIQSCEGVELDRAHFKNFGDFGKSFEVVYFVNTQDYVTFLDRHQQILLGIQRQFEQEEIDFAFPTQIAYRRG